MPSNFVKNLGLILLNGRNDRPFFVHNKWYHARKGEGISQIDCSSEATFLVSSWLSIVSCCSLLKPAISSLPQMDRRPGTRGGSEAGGSPCGRRLMAVPPPRSPDRIKPRLGTGQRRTD